MKLFILILVFFVFSFNSNASIKNNIIENLKVIDNFTFNFNQTIGDTDEKGVCTISYPKKIFCKYNYDFNKVLVSNGKSLVIKNDKNKQYYRYPLESTPLILLLDKKYILNKISTLDEQLIDEKFYMFKIEENDNLINIFFEKNSLKLIGWQTEDIYQNLSVTFIYNLVINEDINEKIFKLPEMY